MTSFATKAGYPRGSRLRRSQPASYSHYDVILIMTSLVTELARPSVTDVWTPYRI